MRVITDLGLKTWEEIKTPFQELLVAGRLKRVISDRFIDNWKVVGEV